MSTRLRLTPAAAGARILGIGSVQPDNVVTFSLSPVLSGYPEERARLFVSEVQERLTAMPGVASASAALVPLVNGNSRGHNVSVEGFTAGADANTAARFNAVGPAYFKTAGTRLLAGREFSAADSAGSATGTGWRSTTWFPPRWSRRMGRSCGPPSGTTRTCSGRCAAAAATSEWSPSSSSGCTRSGR